MHQCRQTTTVNKNTSMRKIIAIGESVLDTLYRNGQPIKAMVGGRIANATASLGMTGAPVTFAANVAPTVWATSSWISSTAIR